MATGLVALFDDIAALARIAAASVDDIAAGTAKASTKAVGVIIDDAAVTPQYVTGLDASRELPIIKKIAMGSIRNKILIILPIILILSQFLPWMLVPLLLLGGSFLCYEGAHKVLEKMKGKSKEKEAPKMGNEPGAEDEIVKSAVTTDFILSAEIMVISLNEVADQPFFIRAAILFVVAIFITALVYGTVAIIVKMDDIGLHLTQKESEKSQKLGHGIIKAMPIVMDVITFIGTIAMLWVGGHIVIHQLHELGFNPIYDFVHLLADPVSTVAGVGGFLAWLVDTIISAIVGLIWGAILVQVIHLIPHREKKVRPEFREGYVPAADGSLPREVLDQK